MNSTNTTPSSNPATPKKKNVPSHEIFLIEGDGKDTRWTKVGVAFPTKSGTSHRVFIGQRGDPKQRVYLVCPNSTFDGNRDAKDNRGVDEPKRIPYATVFDATTNDIDFKRKSN